MADETYRVARHHLGDKDYAPGDSRTADPNAVAHLIEKGVLVKTKADVPAKNKAALKGRNKDG